MLVPSAATAAAAAAAAAAQVTAAAAVQRLLEAAAGMAFSDSSEEGAAMDGFFTNTAYHQRDWSFGELTVRGCTSNAASTDYDLTGQVPWPALTVLGHWLASDSGAAVVRGRSCLELGAGTGITGILAAAQRCASLTLTDHNSYVVDLLEQNIEMNEELFLHMAETPAAVQLDWEDRPPEPSALHLYPSGAEQDGTEPDGFGVILASDCLYCEAAVKPLFDTATHWLAADGVWVMAHIARWDNVEAALAAEIAARPDLTVEEVDLASFLPHAQPGYEPPPGTAGVIGSLRVPAAGADASAAQGADTAATAGGDGGDVENSPVSLDGHSLADAHLRLIRWAGGKKTVPIAAEPEPQPST